MLSIPRWAIPAILDHPCPYCGVLKEREWVCGIGVKETHTLGSKKTNQGNIALSIEYLCPYCMNQYQMIVDPRDFNLTPKDILENILETMNGDAKNKFKTKSKLTQSKISTKEISELNKLLKETNSFSEFLTSIGVDPEMFNKIIKENKDEDK